MTRDEVAHRVAEKYGFRIRESGAWWGNDMFIPTCAVDALISSEQQRELADRFLETERNNHEVSIAEWETAEQRVGVLEEALREIIEEADQSNGCKGARLPKVLSMREVAEAALRERVEG